MSNKKITDLNYYSASQFQPNDLWFITDIAHQETKNTTSEDILDYVEQNFDPYTGSYLGTFTGTASYANNLVYPNTSTASLAISASYSVSGLSSSYAKTASYALNSNGNATFSETIVQNNSFNIGDAVYVTAIQGNTRYFAQATSSFIPNTNYNEVVGIIQSATPTSFVVVYSGIVSFISPPAYFNPYYNGVAYFLNGLGSLSSVDPSQADSTQISKPVLLQVNSSSGLVINQRGLYENLGPAITASYVYFDGITPNGTVFNAITASYALNGGNAGSGSGTTIVNPTSSYYFDSTPIGTVIAYTSGSAPSGWLPCDGAFYPITGANGAYTALYNVISQNNSAITSFGQRYTYNPPIGGQAGFYTLNSNGGYFNVPDLRGIFIRGFNNSLQNDGNLASPYDSGSGRQFGSLQKYATAAPQSLSGVNSNVSGFTPVEPSSQLGFARIATATDNPPTSTTDVTDNTVPPYPNTELDIRFAYKGDSETRPVNIALYYYIKYTQYSISSATAQSIANGNYPLAGDVGGTLAGTIVTGIQGVPISTTVQTPQSGAVLQYNGNQWVSAQPSSNLSAIRCGSAAGVTGTVTFSAPMSSVNYEVFFNEGCASNGSGLPSRAGSTYYAYNKTINGFSFSNVLAFNGGYPSNVYTAWMAMQHI
jgi:hypothetical protein